MTMKTITANVTDTISICLTNHPITIYFFFILTSFLSASRTKAFSWFSESLIRSRRLRSIKGFLICNEGDDADVKLDAYKQWRQWRSPGDVTGGPARFQHGHNQPFYGDRSLPPAIHGQLTQGRREGKKERRRRQRG